MTQSKLLNGLRTLGRRTLSQTAARASGAAAGVTDDPKFYAMVIEFTESAADMLEDRHRLLMENK